MDYSRFLERADTFPDLKRKEAYRICKLATKFADTPDELRSVKTVYRFFYSTQGIGKSNFFKIKNVLLEFYRYLVEEKLVPESMLYFIKTISIEVVTDSINLAEFYFASLDDVLNFITLVGQRKDMADKDDLLYYKVFAILGWHGFGMDDMVEIKKVNLISPKESIVATINGKDFDVYLGNYFDIVKRFSDLTVYNGFPSSKRLSYVDSEYLFRSNKNDHLVPNNMACIIRNFNQDIPDEIDKRLSLSCMRQNGIFCNIYLRVQNGEELYPVIIDLLHCDNAYACVIGKLYRKWEQLYKKGGEK